jgi:hypothetical protein
MSDRFPLATLRVITEIGNERARQQRYGTSLLPGEGWDNDHDDNHQDGELALAGAAYAIHGLAHGLPHASPPALWPWESHWWKPKDSRRNLIRAAAFLVAEIERLDRMAAAQQAQSAPEAGA